MYILLYAVTFSKFQEFFSWHKNVWNFYTWENIEIPAEIPVEIFYFLEEEKNIFEVIEKWHV